MNKISFLILDAGGVMVYPIHGSWDIPANYREYLGSHAAEIGGEKWCAAVAKHAQILREDVFVADMEEEFALRTEFLRNIASEMNWCIPQDRLLALSDDFTYNPQRYCWYDDVDAYLEKWHAKLPIGVLSDAMPSFQRIALQHDARHLFDQLVISTAVGTAKPDLRMYETILRRMNADPARCLFVDDRINNLEGAQRAGMQAVQMDREGKIPLWNGPIVHDFQELDALLEELI